MVVGQYTNIIGSKSWSTRPHWFFMTRILGVAASELIRPCWREPCQQLFSRLPHLHAKASTRLEQHGHAIKYGFELPLSQEQLGHATGMTAVHVNHTLGFLRMTG
jgi:hypothetical protein